MKLRHFSNGLAAMSLLVCAVPAIAAEDNKAQDDKSEWQLKPRWRVQFDTANIDGPTGLIDLGNHSDIRRAQLGVDLKMPGGFSARVEGEFTADPIEFVDAYIAWDRNGVNVTVGQQKTFGSLDDMTSDLNTSFIERAGFVAGFNTTRRLGVSAGYSKGPFMVNAGVFSEPLIALNDARDNSLGLDMRAAWMPSFGKTKLHLGGSLHLRDRNDMASLPQRYRTRPSVNVTDTRYIATPAMTVEKEINYGLEAAAVHGRFHVAGEAQWMRADRPAALTDPQFFGAYAEIGLFLTNDSRPLAGGQFGAIKPSKPLGEGGIGAVQVNVRYDWLDLNDGAIVGGTQDGYLASLIWTPAENFRLLGQYARLDYNDAAIAVAGNRDYSLDVWSLRGQVTF